MAEDGRELYLLNHDCDHSKASDWVKQNVLKLLPEKPLPFLAATEEQAENQRNGYYNKSTIALMVAEFCGCTSTLKKLEIGVKYPADRDYDFALKPGTPKPEFWAYYADYDWVVFCQLFGTMMDLPSGFPMYCRDIKQECDRLGNPKLPKQGENEHNALADAQWVRESWEFLNQLANPIEP